jgi:hypothetical protein
VSTLVAEGFETGWGVSRLAADKRRSGSGSRIDRRATRGAGLVLTPIRAAQNVCAGERLWVLRGWPCSPTSIMDY